MATRLSGVTSSGLSGGLPSTYLAEVARCTIQLGPKSILVKGNATSRGPGNRMQGAVAIPSPRRSARVSAIERESSPMSKRVSFAEVPNVYHIERTEGDAPDDASVVYVADTGSSGG